MNAHSAEKIGGTSIADTSAALHNVLLPARLAEDPYGRIIVVSAYAGITNLLLEHKKTGQPGVYALFERGDSDSGWNEAITHTCARMCEINARVFEDRALVAQADRFVRERIEGVRSCLADVHRLCSFGHFRLDEQLRTVREMLSAIGEAHSAFNTTLLLRQRNVASRFLDLTGWRDDRRVSLEERIDSAFADIDLARELPVVTGYAQCLEGMLERFGRGYTEVTFSQIAARTGAREAVIHKEYHLSSADPKLVEELTVRKIGDTNYDVADQLANMGMEAIHPGAARILRRSGIPLRIRNTFQPHDPGTVIRGNYVSDQPGVEIITGRRRVFALQVFDQEMQDLPEVDGHILQALARRRLTVITKDVNANTVTHFVSGHLKQVRRAAEDLRQAFNTADVSLSRAAIVSIIGSDLRVDGLLGRATSALASAGIDVLALHQGMRRVDIQIVVAEHDFEVTVRTLHGALVAGERPTARAAA